jgi:methylated-DNA-[protein]-cysteine S-methyltransferase
VSLFKSFIKTPVGKIGLLADEENLISLSFTDPNFKELKAKKNSDRFEDIILQLNQYFFEGRQTFDLEYKLLASDFQVAVYEEMLKIPYGKTTSYSDLSQQIGKKKAFRAVGTACGKNPLPLIIPCHRVLGKNDLGGFTGGLNIKKFLLRLERN